MLLINQLVVSLTYLTIIYVSVISGQCNDNHCSAKKRDVGIVIGIDLGTTYSCVGVFVNSRIEIIPNDQGNRITPSYAAFTSDGRRLVGDAAKNQLTSNSENTVFDVKRLIGREWTDPMVQSDIKYYPFRVIDNNDRPYIRVKTKNGLKDYSPQEISAMVLLYMKETAEAYLGSSVTHAVITVPAYFNDAQRQATKDAGAIAGLQVLRIVNEPTAAAIAYGFERKGYERTIVVFDLGGGTFDVSVLQIDQGVVEVLATNGDTHLGGEDFNQRVVDYFVEVYRKKTGKNIARYKRSLQKLRREVERAKRLLSANHKTQLEVEALIDGEDFQDVLTRAKFEELNMDLFRSTLKPLKNALNDAGVSKDKVDDILLIGGSTRIPKIQQLVTEFFNGKEPLQRVNPDEAVAMGASIHAGTLTGDIKDMLLLDVNPLTLGIETKGGEMSKLIPRNNVLPHKVSKTYTTAEDNQKNVLIKVYEGERPLTKDNHLLGQFQLDGIPPAPRDVPKIKVTFEIDANGILKVTAEDEDTHKKKHIVINNDNTRLTPDEIDQKLREAIKEKAVDRKAKERVEAYNDLEYYVYNARKVFSPTEKLGAIISQEDRQIVDMALEEVAKWLDNNNDAELYYLKSRKKEMINKLKPIIDKYFPDGKIPEPVAVITMGSGFNDTDNNTERI
ncbi:endoplasmic reticulum chaperone BiP-like [Oppia nitens]|uniref:endoplasmic reticulum chaperone BiP-like n=1 Tax=Oppia nitens TaxID=1686743 RepID=UPI0023DB717D|nr:endoplasmic reticulum chaperone BiP-like [Oppia nitens]